MYLLTEHFRTYYILELLLKGLKKKNQIPHDYNLYVYVQSSNALFPNTIYLLYTVKTVFKLT